jgi:bleomycin hydrolase
MKRLGLEPVKLARMYPVYYVFLEKAKRFVHTRGASRFAPGDLFSGVLETIATYGIVPEEAYRGQTRVCETFNHDMMYRQLDSLMRIVKANKMCDESNVLAEVVPILTSHLGKPPEVFEYKGTTYTPKAFLEKVVRLPWDEYLLSPPSVRAPLSVHRARADNWAHRDSFRLTLDVFSAGRGSPGSRLFTCHRRGYHGPATHRENAYHSAMTFRFAEITQSAHDFSSTTGRRRTIT